MNGLIASVLAALISIAALGCSYQCSCPEDGCDACSQGTGEILIPAGLPPVSGATTDGPCTVSYQADANRVLVSRPGAGSCVVQVQFSDGASESAQVRFHKVSGPCGCYLAADATPLAP
jgi:hypothetical protein